MGLDCFKGKIDIAVIIVTILILNIFAILQRFFQETEKRELRKACRTLSLELRESERRSEALQSSLNVVIHTGVRTPPIRNRKRPQPFRTGPSGP